MITLANTCGAFPKRQVYVKKFLTYIKSKYLFLILEKKKTNNISPFMNQLSPWDVWILVLSHGKNTTVVAKHMATASKFKSIAFFINIVKICYHILK